MSKELYLANLKKYGSFRQWDKLIEELAELTQAIQKMRYKPTQEVRHNLLEEICDVEIVLAQVKLTLDQRLLRQMYNEKLLKLAALNAETDL